MYDELIAELRQHHCDAKEDDTQEVCEECSYDVIIVDKSAPSGFASVCVCGLMNRAADAIEELSKQFDNMNEANIALYGDLPRWIPVKEQLIHSGWYLVVCNEWGGSAVRKAIYDEATRKWLEFPCGGPKDITKFVTHYMPLPQPPEEE